MYECHDGLATLGPEASYIVRDLDQAFVDWATDIGADEHTYPPLVPARELADIDYFENFPHLATFATRVKDEAREHLTTRLSEAGVPTSDLVDSQYVLPSAACYSIYFGLRGQTLGATRRITTMAQCYRNEGEYTGLARLWGFRMREIVCIGSSSEVEEHLEIFKKKVLRFAESLDLPLRTEAATDPFFDKQSSRAQMQTLFPVKEEFIADDGTAIASLNLHRNFFGERCQIKDAQGDPIFTSCAAFGLERWLHALVQRHGDSIGGIMSALKGAS